METDFNTTWNKKEFKAYVLLYCSQADFSEDNSERGLIVSKVGKENYNHIHEEIEKDNDYVRIQKIISTAKRLDYRPDLLLTEMKQVFFADGEFDVLEHNMLLSLQRLIS